MPRIAAPLTRRQALATAGATLLARGARAATTDPIRIGVLSDVAGPYRNVGGLGGKIAVQMAVEDIGGTLLGRRIEVEQADIQNNPTSPAPKPANGSTPGSACWSMAAPPPPAWPSKTFPRQESDLSRQRPLGGRFHRQVLLALQLPFWADTYSLAKGTGQTLTKAGGNTWFFITADYAFGYSLQANTETFIKAAGGSVAGSVRVPLGTTDFSSALLAAKASNAKVVAFANAGADLQNCIKQAAEFGIVKGGQTLATLLMFITDVAVLGQEVCEGLVLTNSFYWDLTPKTRAWTARFAKQIDLPPTMVQAANYASTYHWLTAVKAANTLDPDIVAAKMRALPVNDFYNDNNPVQPNGQLQLPMHIWRVKPAAKATHKWDYYEPIGDLAGTDAFTPLAESGCSMK